MWKINREAIENFIDIYGGNNGYRFNGRLITNKNDILDACRYIYITKHVLYRGRTQVNPQRWSLHNPNAINERDSLLEELAEKVWNYFNLDGNTPNDQTHFDEFHNELCIWFLNGLNRFRNIEGLDNATFGNSQKMINILFKYLCCFEDYDAFADLFTYCHMPIDNYILGNFIDHQVPNVISIPNEKQFILNNIAQCWHEFDQEHYYDLINKYRKTIEKFKNQNLSFLGVEFFWFSNWNLPNEGINSTILERFHK